MKTKTSKVVAVIFIVSLSSARAQVTGNPPYVLEQAVIASGGGQNSAGGGFGVDGTIGQAAAGTRASNVAYSVTGGFWTTDPLGPSASMVTLSGRTTLADGRGVRNARVVLTGADGTSGYAMTGSFGFFTFAEVEAGQTYVISVVSKRFHFASQILVVNEDVADVYLVAQPEQ